MKIFIILLCLAAVLNAGCNDANIDIPQKYLPSETHDNILGKDISESTADISPLPEAKITSDFENAPDANEILTETNKTVSNVLLQDTLTYDADINDYFAVCLQEDATQAYRWLWVNEEDNFEFVEETHINGYRVFIFEAITAGETSLLFELSQNSTVIETLSYQIIIS